MMKKEEFKVGARVVRTEGSYSSGSVGDKGTIIAIEPPAIGSYENVIIQWDEGTESHRLRAGGHRITSRGEGVGFADMNWYTTRLSLTTDPYEQLVEQSDKKERAFWFEPTADKACRALEARWKDEREEQEKLWSQYVERDKDHARWLRASEVIESLAEESEAADRPPVVVVGRIRL